MKNSLRLFLFGVLTWIVPFVVAFGFYDRQGQLATSYALFKSTMIVVSSLTGCFALYKYFGRVESGHARHGWIVGVVWLAINLLLDLVILIPMSGMGLAEYFLSIGLGYIVIPVICVTGGMMVERNNASIIANPDV